MQQIISIQIFILEILESYELKFHPKIIEAIFNNFLNLYQHAKNQLVPSTHSWDTDKFRVPSPDWPHPFLTLPTQNFFNQLSIFMNLYQYPENQAISSICWRDMVHLKFL